MLYQWLDTPPGRFYDKPLKIDAKKGRYSGVPDNKGTSMLALSIVGPHGSNIATGKKTLEVRSWRPESLPIRDLLIVENSRFLSSDNPTDLNGRAVAIVDVEEVHKWRPSEVEAACSNGWEPGYWAWSLSNVRPVTRGVTVPAKRKLYEVELAHALL